MTLGKRVGFCWDVFQPSGVLSTAGAAGQAAAVPEPLAEAEGVVVAGEPVHAVTSVQTAASAQAAT